MKRTDERNLLKSGLLAVLCTASLAAPCGATVIVSYGFNETGNLAGKTASMDSRLLTNSGAPGWVSGSTTWVARSDFQANGSFSWTGASANDGGSARLDLGSYIWDARGTESGLFTLTSTLSITSGTWISVGFFHSALATGNYFSNGAASGPGMSTAILRNNPATGAYYFSGTGNSGNNATPAPTALSSPVTFTITLDLRTWNGTDNWGSVTFSNNQMPGESWTQNLTDDNDVNRFRYLGFSSFTGNGTTVTGTISNFSLSQIPEPSTALALLAAPALLGLRRRR